MGKVLLVGVAAAVIGAVVYGVVRSLDLSASAFSDEDESADQR